MWHEIRCFALLEVLKNQLTAIYIGSLLWKLNGVFNEVAWEFYIEQNVIVEWQFVIGYVKIHFSPAECSKRPTNLQRWMPQCLLGYTSWLVREPIVWDWNKNAHQRGWPGLDQILKRKSLAHIIWIFVIVVALVNTLIRNMCWGLDRCFVLSLS